MSSTLLSIRNDDAVTVPIEQVEELVVMSLLPFIEEDSYSLACSFFADCMSGYDEGVGTLYVSQGKKHPEAFAFVFDQAPIMSSAPHLHICSAFHLYKGKRSVSNLLRSIIDLNNGRLTLECQPELLSYFEKKRFSN
jgi:hypothetical protein